MTSMAALKPEHFLWRMENNVGVIQLARPERKNPLTFASYAELRDTFRAIVVRRLNTPLQQLPQS